MNTNHRLFLEIGIHFLNHLEMELNKDSKVIDAISLDGQTPRQINSEIKKNLIESFPELKSYPSPNFNLFLVWWEKNKFVYPYESFSLESYNIIFYYRLLSLRDWSEESQLIFHNKTLEVFEKFDYKRPGFAVTDFLNYENNMRELLREIVLGMFEIDEKKAWDLIYEQSRTYQAIVNEFFEKILQDALNDSERLLQNILPKKIASELKSKNSVEPIHVPSATVLFTDFKGFTQLSEQMSANQLIAELDECFSIFDAIIDLYGLEKIKTIGDSYMCAGGIPEFNKTHTVDCALAALQMRNEMNYLLEKRNSENKPYWKVRIGFHSGDLTAGVIGQKKFSYDIWGDTVNIASRMESSGIPCEVNVSSSVYEVLDPFFVLEPRGKIEAKNKGKIEMYLLKGLRKRFQNGEEEWNRSSTETLQKPKTLTKLGNPDFWNLYEKLKNGAKISRRKA
ncbi:MAG: adenylate/guanylate cyclase domain-containing protein [Leptospira sp.]|nr:adenylate/guanylate cyclase domain-containing protein [Leptospira sp.]